MAQATMAARSVERPVSSQKVLLASPAAVERPPARSRTRLDSAK
jgi:hypothetical protein